MFLSKGQHSELMLIAHRLPGLQPFGNQRADPLGLCGRPVKKGKASHGRIISLCTQPSHTFTNGVYSLAGVLQQRLRMFNQQVFHPWKIYIIIYIELFWLGITRTRRIWLSLIMCLHLVRVRVGCA